MYTEIKSYEDACAVNKQDPNLYPDVSNLPEDEGQYLIDSLQLIRVVRAINTRSDGSVWKPNYYDRSQPKYTGWFEVEATKDKPSGVGFSLSYYVFWYSFTSVGSRLCFETLDQLKHAQKYFKPLFVKVLLIKD